MAAGAAAVARAGHAKGGGSPVPGGVRGTDGSVGGARRPDTARLQKAIDGCAPGKAVELKPDGYRQTFLSGPLVLKAGVTLLIDADAALFASRDPRDYDLTPGGCGVVNQRGRGCKPFLLAERAPGSGIMGDGAIDGRGGATLVGQNVSWWDLAREAKIKVLSQSVTRLLTVRRATTSRCIASRCAIRRTSTCRWSAPKGSRRGGSKSRHRRRRGNPQRT